MSIETILQRPLPPDALVTMDGLTAPDTFVPAPEIEQWIRDAFLASDGPLHWPGHQHLQAASIGCLWTSAENVKAGRRIVGQAEMPNRVRGGRWQQARAMQQLREWFGHVPDFLLTIDALYAAECDDRSWCCLVEHELRHCGQAEDEFGCPRFNKDTGEPVFTLVGHDIEAFVMDAARYGPEALGDDAVNFLIAAAGSDKRLSDTQIAMACGGRVAKKRMAA